MTLAAAERRARVSETRGGGRRGAGQDRRLRAHGLQLTWDFPLPGLTEAAPAAPAAAPASAPEAPRLRARRCTPAELLSRWSGASGPPCWRGRQGDGLELAIERGTAGDTLFSYGRDARFLLNRDMTELDCSPAVDGPGWQRVLIGKVIPAVSVMIGYEGLHAAALDTPDGVVAIMAPSGGGKSTLTAALLGRGWSLFADDQLTLSRHDGIVRAHPGTSHMNIAQDHPPAVSPLALGESLAIVSGEHWLAVRRTCRRERPVALLCLLERAPGLTLDCERLAPTPLALAPYVLGLSEDPARLRERFLLHADLMREATLVRVTAGLEHSPHELAGLLERALAVATRTEPRS